MNKERLLELADVIERAPVQSFDMDHWLRLDLGSPCGTVACIAGHACLHFVTGYHNRFEAVKECGVRVNEEFENFSKAARGVLELTEKESNRLFYASEWPGEWEDRYVKEKEIRNKVAAAYIREFVRTDGFDSEKEEA